MLLIYYSLKSRKSKSFLQNVSVFWNSINVRVHILFYKVSDILKIYIKVTFNNKIQGLFSNEFRIVIFCFVVVLVFCVCIDVQHVYIHDTFMTFFFELLSPFIYIIFLNKYKYIRTLHKHCISKRGIFLIVRCTLQWNRFPLNN